MLCACGACFFAKETILITNSNLKVEAVVKDIRQTTSYRSSSYNNRFREKTNHYSPVFAYRFGEKDYLEIASTSSKSPTYQKGEKAFLFIDPENHQRFIIDSFGDKWKTSLIFSVMAFLFGLVSLIKTNQSTSMNGFFSKSFFSFKKGKITAEVVAVTQDTSMTINNKVCYVIEAVHKPTGRKFKSDPLTDYPFEYRVGTLVEVVLDPKNPYQGKILLTNVRKVA